MLGHMSMWSVIKSFLIHKKEKQQQEETVSDSERKL